MKPKVYKVHCPAMTVKGLKAPKTTLRVVYSEHTIGLPWEQVRPLVACAFRHVQRTAFIDLREEFLHRSRYVTPQLTLKKGSRYYTGRSTGDFCRVSIGQLHTEPRETTYPRYKDMPVFWHADWRETLLGIVAHELWHRWQPGHGRSAEFVCELVESDAIDAYRREMGYTFTPPTNNENETIASPADATPDELREHLVALPNAVACA